MSIHAETHPSLDVAGCFGCKLTTLSIAASAMPTRRPQAAQLKERDARWSRENDAYRRLIKDGVQPAAVNGCDVLEKHADTVVQVEHGLNASEAPDAA